MSFQYVSCKYTFGHKKGLVFLSMVTNDSNINMLPSSDEIRRAVEIYIHHAYFGQPPENVQHLMPKNENFNSEQWIMGDMVEREPADSTPQTMRWASFRFGNIFYPNMKFRISRIPKSDDFIFSVDSHDAILQAQPDSADYAMLEKLKSENAKLAKTITEDWDKASLPTERNYMRHKIQQAKKEKNIRDE